MHDFTNRLNELYHHWVTGLATGEEVDELTLLLEKPGAKEALSPLMKAAWEQKRETGMQDEKLQNIALQIVNKNREEPETTARVAHRVNFLRTAWFRYAAAIVVILGTVMYFQVSRTKEDQTTTASVKNDVPAPLSGHATLTLANGQQININGSSAGELAREGNIEIQRNANGEIIYGGNSSAENNTQYNILTVPRGGRIATIFLSDGTRVFLNSASSLKYPVQFTGTERRVELVGEAYFEVAKNAKSKFVVSNNKMVTEVLGTSFNVHAYPEDDEATVTLLTGAVKINSEKQSAVLKPGEQGLTRDNNSLMVNNNINTDEVIAWKNGYFQFEQATLSTIAKEVSRWYNVNFVFENKLAAKETFHATFSRNSTLSELLKILEFTDVKFEIKGNEVIIK